MNTIIKREERQEDEAAIHGLNEEAFRGSAEANIVDALRRGGKVTLSLVAEIDAEAVGNICLSPVAVDSGETVRIVQGLAPMAVVPAL